MGTISRPRRNSSQNIMQVAALRLGKRKSTVYKTHNFRKEQSLRIHKSINLNMSKSNVPVEEIKSESSRESITSS